MTQCSLVGGCQTWKMEAVCAVEPCYQTYEQETTYIHTPEDQNMKLKDTALLNRSANVCVLCNVADMITVHQLATIVQQENLDYLFGRCSV
jgi:hypothetical protein